jgi:hypothetical protein
VLCAAVGLDRLAVLGISVGAPSPWRVRSGCPSG